MWRVLVAGQKAGGCPKQEPAFYEQAYSGVDQCKRNTFSVSFKKIIMTEKVSKKQFEEAFLSFHPQLLSYLLRLSGHKQDAEDIAQNAYLKAARNLDNFLGKSSLKTWVFTIATNLLRDHFRAKKRWTENCQENARYDAFAHPERIETMKNVSANSVAGTYDLKEHIDFCFTCMAKTLSIEQQIAVILKDIYQFKHQEIMQITQLSEGKVKHALSDGRKILIKIFDRKCALISKKGVCHQCSELNNILNPLQDAQAEALKLRMKHEAEKGAAKTHLYQLRLDLIRAIDPLRSKGTDLHTYFLELMPQYCDTKTDK